MLCCPSDIAPRALYLMLSQIYGRPGTHRIALPYMRAVNPTMTLINPKTVSYVSAPSGQEEHLPEGLPIIRRSAINSRQTSAELLFISNASRVRPILGTAC